MKINLFRLIAVLMPLFFWTESGFGQSKPPEITNQPASQTAVYGQNCVFNVGAGGPGPLTYQWSLNGTNLPNGVITTVAGNGVTGYSGNGGMATNANMCYPYGLAVDEQGDLFIADTYNNHVREVTTNGIINNIAGIGLAGFSGDGRAATNAFLDNPYGVAVDAGGVVYFVDAYNNCVREVDTNGIIITVAGDGGGVYSGDGGPATNASLEAPEGMAVDMKGALYIADSYDDRIRKVDSSGIITTVAGIGGPRTNNYYGDGGAATNAGLAFPEDVFVDGSGNLFIADSFDNRVRKVDTNGIITTVAGNGTAGYFGDGGLATNAELNKPWGVAVDALGDLYISDSENSRIRKVDTHGIITSVAGKSSAGYSGDGGVAANASLNGPRGIAVDASGNLVFSDTANSRVRRVTWQSSMLPVASVNPANAGNYQVIITSPWGSVTSSVATLTVMLPQIAVSAVTNSAVTLNLFTAPSVSSELWTATNLIPPVVWQPVYTNVPGTNGVWQFTDTKISQSPVRFYRTSTP